MPTMTCKEFIKSERTVWCGGSAWGFGVEVRRGGSVWRFGVEVRCGGSVWGFDQTENHAIHKMWVESFANPFQTIYRKRTEKVCN